MRELVIIVLLVVAADVLTSDTRQYATRIFSIFDPVTGAWREAHPHSPSQTGVNALMTFEQRWPAPDTNHAAGICCDGKVQDSVFLGVLPLGVVVPPDRMPYRE